MQFENRRSRTAALRIAALALLVAGPAGTIGAIGTIPSSSDEEIIGLRPWPHEVSDLRPLPSIEFGHLKNGVRFAWRPFGDPPGEVFLWLHVRCGSTSEADDERGLAHTIEHLVLRHSGNRAAGELKIWAEQHGMEFGPDLNGFTSWGETTYVLHAYHNDPKLIRECLHALRDIAVDGRFDAKDLEIERGVINAEEATRESAAESRRNAFDEHFFAGSKLASRHPIGVRGVRDHFTLEQATSFYRRHYVPQNFTIVMVGALEDGAKRAIEEAFGSIPVAKEVPKDPDLRGFSFPASPRVVIDPRLDKTFIRIEHVVETDSAPRSFADEVKRLPLAVARIAMQRRLAMLPEQYPEDLLDAELYEVSPTAVTPRAGVGLTIEAATESWEAAVSRVIEQIALVNGRGFSRDEIADAKRIYAHGLEVDGDHDRTRLSSEKCECMLGAASGLNSAIDPLECLQRIRPMLEKLGDDEVSKAVATAFDGGHALAAIALPRGDREAIAKELASRLDETKIDVDAVSPTLHSTEFAYSHPHNVPRRIPPREKLDDSVEHLVFENGVEVYFRPQPSGRVEVRAVFGGGRASVPAELRWMPNLSEGLFVEMGLGKHSAPDWRLVLEQHDIDLSFVTNSGSFHLGGNCASDELLSQCRLIAAYLEDPGFRRSALLAIRRGYPGYFESLEHDAMGRFTMEFLPAVLKNDAFKSIAQPADVAAFDVARLRNWLAPQVTSGKLMVIFWGGFEVNDAAAIATATFGSLPKRSNKKYIADQTDRELATGLHREYTLTTSSKKATVQLLFPSPSLFHDEPSLNAARVLSRVLADRLFRTSRERLGWTYAPTCDVYADPNLSNWGWIGVHFEVDPGLEDDVAKLTLEVADRLASDGVEREELDRLTQPMLEEQEDRPYHDRLSELYDDEHALERYTRERAFYVRPDRDAIGRLAAQYLKGERADVAIFHVAKGP